jgi:hypothetical protein
VRDFEHRLLSRPVKLHWAGWTADTLSLQQAGWALSAHQDIARMQMAIALRHPTYGSGVSAHVDWHFMEDWDHYQRISKVGHIPDLPVHVLGRPVHIETMNTDWSAFEPIDAKPQMFDVARRTGNLEDFVHFAPSLARTKEIIIPEQSVPELMERILQLQQPDREARIRKDIMRNPDGYELSGVPRQKFHAQILSLAA